MDDNWQPQFIDSNQYDFVGFSWTPCCTSGAQTIFRTASTYLAAIAKATGVKNNLAGEATQLTGQSPGLTLIYLDICSVEASSCSSAPRVSVPPKLAPVVNSCCFRPCSRGKHHLFCRSIIIQPLKRKHFAELC